MIRVEVKLLLFIVGLSAVVACLSSPHPSIDGLKPTASSTPHSRFQFVVSPNATNVRPNLHSRDVELSNLHLGLTEAEVIEKKGLPTVKKEQRHLSYTVTLGFEMTNEYCSFNDNGRLSKITGWELKVPTLSIDYKRGLQTNRGLVLQKVFGLPDDFDDYGATWVFDDFSLDVLVDGDRVTGFFVKDKNPKGT